MRKPSREETVRALLKMYGYTYSQELGINIKSNSPEALFRLLTATLLFSVRIGSKVAVQAADAMARRGWTTPVKMLNSTWKQRVKALDAARYVRYDESRAEMLEEVAEQCLQLYGGDLRKLREEARRDPARERELLKEFKGIGDVGVDIFFREAQAAWDELNPFAGRKALGAAKKLGLGGSERSLARLVGRKKFPLLAAALVRVDLAHDYNEVLNAARREIMV